MKKLLMLLLTLSVGSVGIWACGSGGGGGGDDDYGAGGEYLQVVSVTDPSGNDFRVQLVTRNSDGTFSLAQGIGAEVNVKNTGRLQTSATSSTTGSTGTGSTTTGTTGTTQSTDLVVTEVTMAYLNGTSPVYDLGGRAISANPQYPNVSIEPGATAPVPVNLLPPEALVPLADIFRYGTDAQVNAARSLTVKLTVYAEDAMDSGNTLDKVIYKNVYLYGLDR